MTNWTTNRFTRKKDSKDELPIIDHVHFFPEEIYWQKLHNTWRYFDDWNIFSKHSLLIWFLLLHPIRTSDKQIQWNPSLFFPTNFSDIHHFDSGQLTCFCMTTLKEEFLRKCEEGNEDEPYKLVHMFHCQQLRSTRIFLMDPWRRRRMRRNEREKISLEVD